MKQLNYEFKKILHKHPISQSHATCANAQKMARKIATDLHSGHNQLSTKSIRDKHVFRLVEIWKKQGHSEGYMKNLMSVLRHVVRFGGTRNAISPANARYGIEKRQYVTNKDKSIKVGNENMDKIGNKYVHLSLLLQDAFMLRAEESMKIQPGLAYVDDHKGERLVLKGSWCKGGRPREIPIVSDYQVELLDYVKVFAADTPRGSLVPEYPPGADGVRRDYKHHLRTYKRETKKAGCSHTHGIRHGAAHRYYNQRTMELALDRHGKIGWQCKAAGGPASTELEPWRREIDREVRREIMGILGHGPDRWDVVAIYLGR